MLNTENTVLILIDVQGKLADVMHKKSMLFDNLQRLIKGMRVLGIPIIWVEHCPESLGPTIPEISNLLSDIKPISKHSFSCCGCDEFMQKIKKLNRQQVLIAGIETHICIYQTVRDLLNLRYEIQILTDAVSSRTRENFKIGLERIKDLGAALTSIETVLFELLKEATGERFKEILKIVK